MKRVFTLVSFVTITVVASLRGQGFTDLDFESAQLVLFTNPPAAGYWIAVTNALPGWSLLEGTNELSVIPYNGYGGHAPQLFGSNNDVISGNFDLLLGGTLTQTGLVPSGTESLLFDAIFSPSMPFQVSLGGVNLSYTAIASATNSYGLSYSVYAADISEFTGQVETLTFFAPSSGYLDDIQFSPEMIPEPSPAVQVFLGSGILFYVRKRRRFRS